MASITIHTPTRSIKVRDRLTQSHIWEQEIENNVAKVAMPKLFDSARNNINEQIYLLASLFQMCVARTPVDENWTDKKTGEHHTADKNRVKWDWYMSDGSVKLTYTIRSAKWFSVVGEEASIQKIVKDIKRVFKSQKTGILPHIYNDNEHFDAVEYGKGYQWPENSPSKIGAGGLPHGVKNRHSVQAPAGMWRISFMQYERERRKIRFRKPLTKRFGGKEGGVKRNPPPKELKELVKLMKKKKIKYGDISKYL